MVTENSSVASSLLINAIVKRTLLKNIIPAIAIIFLFLAILKLYGLSVAISITALEVAFLVLAVRFPILSIQFLILAYAISPKLWAGSGEFFITLEDLITLSIILVAIKQYIPKVIKPTPLDNLLLLFLIVAVIASLLGIFYHVIQSPLQSILYIFKIIEYIAGFYFAFYIVKTQKDEHNICYAFLFSALIISAIGFIEWLRVYMPDIVMERPFRVFDNPVYKGESNHIAGFLMITAIICASMLTARKNVFRLVGTLAIILIGLFLTLSREAILSLFVAMILLTLLFRRPLITLLLFAITLLTLFFYSPFGKRFSDVSWEIESFQHTLARTEVGYSPDFSYTRNRFENWSIALDEWRSFWLFGSGIGSRHRVFYENQYIMILAETGLVGLTLFLILVAATIKALLKATPLHLSKCTICVIVGVLIMGFFSISFLISRIAGPLWILIGTTLSPKEN